MKKNLPELRLGFSFFAVAAFLLSGDLYRNYLYALVFSLIHEAGHLVAMLFFGVIAFGSRRLRIVGIIISRVWQLNIFWIDSPQVE